MPTAPDQITENIEFAAQELLEAPDGQRATMLEQMAKSLTRRLLRDNPGIGNRQVSNRVTAFVNAVRRRVGQSTNKEGLSRVVACPLPSGPCRAPVAQDADTAWLERNAVDGFGTSVGSSGVMSEALRQ
jgi:hypothetical protein